MFDGFKSAIVAELKRVKYHDLEDMVNRMDITYDEIMVVLDIRNNSETSIAYTLAHGINKSSNFNAMINFLLPHEVKEKIRIDDIKLGSNLTTNITLRFLKNLFSYNTTFYSILFRNIGDIESFARLTPGSYESDKPITITGIDKIHLKCDCLIEFVVNVVREPIWYTFALDKPPDHKICEQPKIKLFKIINKSVLSLLICLLCHFTLF